MRIGVGAEKVLVTRYLATQAQPILRVELALQHDGLAERVGEAHEAAGAGVIERAGR